MDQDRKFLLPQRSLDDGDGSTCSDEHEKPWEHRCEHSTMRKALIVSVTVNVAMVVALLAAACSYRVFRQGDHGLRGVQSSIDSRIGGWTPAQEAVQYTWSDMWSLSTKFRGPPGPDYSSIWSDLLSDTLLNVTDDEIKHAGEIPSIRYQTGGYAAALGVGHDLHCVKRIKDFLWLEQVHPEVERNSSIYSELLDHTDHCLDILRQQIMCQPDTSLYYLMYIDHSRVSGKPAPARQSQQKCVDFARLKEWMHSRAGNSTLIEKPDWLTSKDTAATIEV